MQSLFSEHALENKHILITGATGGIGYETAKRAILAGACVSLTGRNEEKLQQLKEECLQLKGDAKVLVVSADLTNDQDRQQLVTRAIHEIGPIFGLVNSAGITGGGTLDKLNEEEMRSTMELNYFSTVMLTQLVYKEMQKEQEGAIVNLSSLSGLRGTYGNTSYSASKFAITAFTQSFAFEAIESNVRVNAVCPGFVDTEMGRNAIKKISDRNGRSFEEQLSLVKEGIPSGRISTPQEVANSILFLLSDATGNIVGESLKISGGSVMR